MSDQVPVLEARGLGKTYLDAGGALTVLHDVDLTVRAGESVAVMGASGAGKSTLLHLLGGLDAASHGEVWVDGRSLTGLGERERSRLRNRSLGFIYQFHHLLDEFTARENIAMPLLIGGMAPAGAGQAADAMLDRLGLAARGHHKPGQLSGGERQRVAIRSPRSVTRPRCSPGRRADRQPGPAHRRAGLPAAGRGVQRTRRRSGGGHPQSATGAAAGPAADPRRWTFGGQRLMRPGTLLPLYEAGGRPGPGR